MKKNIWSNVYYRLNDPVMIRLAVLYADQLVIYDRTLTEIVRLDETDRAGGVRMDRDGTALLIAETSAWRFLP